MAMRTQYLHPLLLALGFLIALTHAALASDSCDNFALEVDLADRAYVDWQAYLGSSDDSDLASTSFSVFSHFLDVADEYSQSCDIAGHKDVFRKYYRLDWLRREQDYALADRADKSTIVDIEAAELGAQWADGFANVDPADYAVMKQTTMNHFSELGLEFRSPETGKVIVKANAAVANCEDNDHGVSVAGVVIPYPRDAASAKFGGKFDVSLTVEETGAPSDVRVDLGDYSQLHDARQIDLSSSVASELKAEVEAATWGPAITECKPEARFVTLTATLDPATQTVTLTNETETQLGP